jgi:hypothetical protein
VGSVDSLVRPEELRPRVTAAVARGPARAQRPVTAAAKPAPSRWTVPAKRAG